MPSEYKNNSSYALLGIYNTVQPWLSRPHLSGTSIIRTCLRPAYTLVRMHRGHGWWILGGVVTVEWWPTCRQFYRLQNWLTCVLLWTLLTMIMLYRYRLKARYHKSGEKSRHFSYPDYFTYPVCHDQLCGQMGPDNRGCTVCRGALYYNSLVSRSIPHVSACSVEIWEWALGWGYCRTASYTSTA